MEKNDKRQKRGKVFLAKYHNVTEQIEEDYKNIILPDAIVLDTETTGIDSGDEILELAIVSIDGSMIFNHRFHPDHHIEWREAQSVNHISPEDVADEYLIKVYKSVIQKILNSAYTIVGYNVFFDISMLENSGFSIDEKKAKDIMEPFAEIYGEWNDYWEDYTWQKLTTCAHYYGYDWGSTQAHGALADTMATLFCWRKICDKYPSLKLENHEM